MRRRRHKARHAAHERAHLALSVHARPEGPQPSRSTAEPARATSEEETSKKRVLVVGLGPSSTENPPKTVTGGETWCEALTPL